MKPPLYVRPLTNAGGEAVPRIALLLGCDRQTVRNAIHAFERTGPAACLERRSKRPPRIHAKLDAAGAERLRALLHRSPRTFGKETSVWTPDLAADVALEQGITAERVSDETVRTALRRLGVAWKRAKRRIASPDPAYGRKKRRATA